MILTGPEVTRQHALGNIVIEPFSLSQVNPNSVNYRLGPLLKECSSALSGGTVDSFEIPEDGYVLRPGHLYLGHTAEVLGSPKYAMSLIGRSSIGRLGLYLQVSANLGHRGACHRWTLELVPTKAIRVYSGDNIGQISFWTTSGPHESYAGYYGQHDVPTQTRLGSELPQHGAPSW